MSYPLGDYNSDQTMVKPPDNVHERTISRESLLSGKDQARKDVTDNIVGASSEIWLAAAVVSVPMLVLAGTLLGLTLAYRLDKSDPWFRSTDYANASSDAGSFYLDISSTKYVTVASWTSNIAPQLSAFVLMLFSYRVALTFWSALKSNSVSSLPTPFQFSLLVRAATGGLTPFWYLGKYRWSIGQQGLSPALARTYLMLFVTLILGYAVWTVDTWLHFTTSAVNLSRGNTNTSSYEFYGRSLWCSGPDPETGSCSTKARGLGMVGEAFLTLNNMSSEHLVSVFHQDGLDYAYLTSPNVLNGVDYEASTYAVGTQCQSATSSGCYIQCGMSGSEMEVLYTCNNFDNMLTGNPANQGDMNTTIQFLDGPNATTANAVNLTRSNPFSFTALTMTEDYNTGLEKDRDCLMCSSNSTPYITWILACTATVFDIRYRWTNGSFERALEMSPSNSTLGVTVSSPFDTGAGKMTLFNTASTAVSQSSVASLADTYALVYSKTALSLVAGVMSQQKNIGQGEPLLGTRVEKPPLFTLLVLNCIYPIMALSLAIVALRSELTKTKEIQARIGIAALTAHSLEPQLVERPVRSTQEFFSEWHAAGAHGYKAISDTGDEAVKRVGFVQTADGGWKYKLFKQA